MKAVLFFRPEDTGRDSAVWHLCVLAWLIHQPQLQCLFISSLIFTCPDMSLPVQPQGQVRQLLIHIPSPSLQDDMHRVIDRQLMDTQLKEQGRPAAAFSRGHGVGRGQEPSTMDGKRLFSFFRKI